MGKGMLLWLVMFTAGNSLQAQIRNETFRFHSVNSLVLINGSNAVSASIQSVNGFKKGAWYAGIGTGIDYYLYRSIPLFADFRYEAGKKNNFFAYADGGINISWVQNKFNTNPILFEGGWGNSTYQNGFYTDAGVGVSLDIKKRNALVFSLGHSYKSLTQIHRYPDWRSREWLSTRTTYHLNRIMLKAGWRL